MPRLIKQRSLKTGQPPGTLVHVGERKVREVIISTVRYDATRLEEQQVERISECFPVADESLLTWVNVTGLHEIAVLQDLGECFGLHPLVLEDILNTEQRPKMEDFGDYVFVVLKMIRSSEESELEPEQVSLVLGPSYVISVHEAQVDDFQPIRKRLRSGAGRLRHLGADYLAYALLDTIVDSYFETLESIGEQMEMLEDELLSRPDHQTLHRIHQLKQNMIVLRRSVWPLREVIGAIERGESPLIQESTQVYLRDLYDHTIQVMDVIESYRDMLSAMLEVYLSSISNTMNAVMKVLTIIGTIFIPLTFIAGIYGMNFRYMPELEARWGYPAVCVVMLAVAGAMLVYFRRKRWL
jgi:magnesium transporter